MDERIQRLADIITEQHLTELLRRYPNYPNPERQTQAHIHHGVKYTRIDVGGSGRYMIDAEGNIYGIKGYGVIHRGHWYGTLDTIDDYYWGGYVAIKKTAKPRQIIPTRPANILTFRRKEVSL